MRRMHDEQVALFSSCTGQMVRVLTVVRGKVLARSMDKRKRGR